MSRRRKSVYSLPKLKLKQKTVVTVATFISFIFAILSAASLVTKSAYLSFWRDFLKENFGVVSFASPIVFVLVGLVLHKTKWKYAQMNILVGFITMLIPLMGLFAIISASAGGSMGVFLWEESKNIATSLGAVLIFLLVFIIGLIVFLDTNPGEVLAFLSGIPQLLAPMGAAASKVGGLVKRGDDLSGNGPKIKLSGIDEEYKAASNAKVADKTPQKEAIPVETLVQNVAGQTRVWKYPPVQILTDKGGAPANRGDVKKNAAIIEKTLDSFGIQARVAEVNGGPAVTQYALEIATGTKIAKIANLQNDIALALATRTGTVRIEAPIPGKSLVGIEVPNHSLEIVTLRSVMASEEMKKHKSRLAVNLGKDTASNPVIVDLDKMPHVLVAGTTGSGKSVLMHSIILSLIFRNSPDELKLILIDPKRVEMTYYNEVPHLLSPVIVEPEKILSALKWAMAEMDRRYKLFQQVGVRNIQGFNEMSGFQALPYIVIMIDELADLMMFAPVEVEDAITRLAQLARATGIHLVVATQRPSVDVITGLMKANIPARIAFNVASLIDSRVIIDTPGAEKLLGRGDMLFLSPDSSKPIRIQGVFSEPDIQTVTKCLKEMGIGPQYTTEVTEMPVGRITKGSGAAMGGGAGGGDGQDDLFEEAVRTVCQYDRASASLLQRRLKVGYARAARIIDELEAAGVIGAGDGSKPREVLTRNPDEYFANQAGAE
jgi:DNA segregation ATPase FtsK/SpoIIIE, S-DNA-T family